MSTPGSNAVQRPQPIAEIVIGRVDHMSRVIWLTVSSEDARRWVFDEAQSLGALHVGKHANEYALVVSDAYDVDQVKAWLEGGYQA